MSVASLESSFAGLFAAFLSAAATADAHWYSLKLLIEGVPSLAGLLGMSNGNLDKILSLSAFGRITKGGGLAFYPDKFKNFLAVSDTEAFCEHTLFRIKGFSKAQHFIRVGSVNRLSMSKPGTIGLGPRIHNLKSLQTNFLNSIASKSPQFAGGGAFQDQSSGTAAVTNTKPACAPDRTAADLTILRVKANLLPLILK
jgi:hypothetical protein